MFLASSWSKCLLVQVYKHVSGEASERQATCCPTPEYFLQLWGLMQLGCSSNVLLFKAHIAEGGLPDRSKSRSLTRQQLSDVSEWLSNSTMSVCMHLHHTCHAISWCGESHRGVVNLHDENAGDMNSSEQREDIPLTLWDSSSSIYSCLEKG